MAKVNITGGSFPLAILNLEPGEKAQIQSGAMVYRDSNVKLNTRVNAQGSGIGKVFKAIGRAMTSGESFFVTEVASATGGQVALAPNSPGAIEVLKIGGNQQYRLNDGAFLALTGNAHYEMKSQGLGKAIFGKQGGLFIMTTTGEGEVLINAFGSIHRLELNGDEITVDNGHVLAWSTSLDYNLHLENGLLNSIGTGEGIVNTFRGHGEVLIQSLNLNTFAQEVGKSLVTGESHDSGSNLVGAALDLLS